MAVLDASPLTWEQPTLEMMIGILLPVPSVIYVCLKNNKTLALILAAPSLLIGMGNGLTFPMDALAAEFRASEIRNEQVFQEVADESSRRVAMVVGRPVGAYARGWGWVVVMVEHRRWLALREPLLIKTVYGPAEWTQYSIDGWRGDELVLANGQPLEVRGLQWLDTAIVSCGEYSVIGRMLGMLWMWWRSRRRRREVTGATAPAPSG
ncbi:MAG: hypothetical protein AB1486_25755 [Planctomycetota bacterium]